MKLFSTGYRRGKRKARPPLAASGAMVDSLRHEFGGVRLETAVALRGARAATEPIPTAVGLLGFSSSAGRRHPARPDGRWEARPTLAEAVKGG